ncbi:serine O-acetyltransferase [Candidatus Bipolaricaulota bacterium]|nr:serine O-acetyltransferase [Candidatus Bipolaricaulota bacterium]
MSVLDDLRHDIEAVSERDPAARNLAEVLCCYPGLHALWLHRVAHLLWRHHLKLLGRLVSHVSRFLTNIEIHPGAEIGSGVFIDHGSGVVIGETAEIGDDVLLFQGVVLGGTSRKSGKRHPTLKNNVEIGAGGILLGPITIGEDARVGAGSVVTKSIPPTATAVGVPAQVSKEGSRPQPSFNLDHADIPDPLGDAFDYMLKRQLELEETVEELEDRLDSQRDECEVDHSNISV